MTESPIVISEDIPSNEELNPQSESHHILVVEDDTWSMSHPQGCDPFTEPGCPYLDEATQKKFADKATKTSGAKAFKVSGDKKISFTEVKDAVLNEVSEGDQGEDTANVYAVVPDDLPADEPEPGPEATWPVQEPGEQPIPAPAAEEPAALPAPEDDDER